LKGKDEMAQNQPFNTLPERLGAPPKYQTAPEEADIKAADSKAEKNSAASPGTKPESLHFNEPERPETGQDQGTVTKAPSSKRDSTGEPNMTAPGRAETNREDGTGAEPTITENEEGTPPAT